MTIVEAHLAMLPGIPDQNVLEEITSTLLGPMLEFSPRIDDGPSLSQETGLQPLFEMMQSRPHFTARGTSEFEAIFKWLETVGVTPNMTSWLRLFVAEEAVDLSVLVQSVAKVLALTGGPMAYIDLTSGNTGFSKRRKDHVETFQRDKQGRDRIFTFGAGFSGIPGRLFLGPDATNFFGTDRLNALSSELAYRTDQGVWILSPCQRLADWTVDQRCRGEEQIITQLGRDCFYDPVTHSLPTRTPELPEVARIPVRVRRKDSADSWTWERHNGLSAPRAGI